MPEDGGNGRRGPRRRALRLVSWCAVVLVGVLAGAAIALALAGNRLAEHGIARVLGTAARVEGLSLLGRVRAARVDIGPVTATLAGEVPPVTLRGLDLDYVYFPREGAYFPSFSVERATIVLDGADPARRNYQFLLDFLARPATGVDPRPYIPREFTVRNLALWGATLQAGGAVEGLELAGRFDGWDDFGVRMQGEALTVRWRDTSGVWQQAAGAAEARLDRTSGALFSAGMAAEVPAFVSGSAEGTATMTPFGIQVEAAARDIMLLPNALALIPEGLLPLAVTFDSVEVASAQARGLVGPGSFHLPGSSAELLARGLRVGEPGHELYDGDLEAALGTGEDGQTLHVAATLNRGQRLTADLSGGVAAGRAEAALTDWSRADMLAAVPADLRAAVDGYTAFRALDGTATFAWTPGRYSAEVILSPDVPVDDAGATVRMRVAGRMEGDWAGGPATGRGRAEAVLEGQTLEAVDLVMADDTVAGTLVFSGLDPALWARAVPGTDALGELRVALTGAAEVRAGLDGSMTAHADLSSPTLAYGDLTIPPDQPFTLRGPVRYEPESRMLTGEALALAVDDRLDLDLLRYAFSTENFTGSAEVGGRVDLSLLAQLAPGLWGDFEFQGAVRKEQDAVLVAADATGRTFGYGDLAAPYGEETGVHVLAEYDHVSGRGAVKELRAGLQQTELVVTGGVFQTDPFTLTLPFTLTTMFEPLVALGYLGSAMGNGEAHGTLNYDGETLSAQSAVRAEAESLDVPAALTSVGGLSLMADAGWEGGLAGSGQVAAVTALAAGAKVDDVRVGLTFEGARVLLHDGTLDVFGGRLAFGGELGLLAEGLPGRVRGELTDGQLERLAEEFDLGDTELTGIADGTVAIAFGLDGLREFEARFVSTEGFAISRELVIELLMLQYAGETTGIRQVRRIVEQVVGTAELRPFDRGEVALSLEDGELTGQALLRSHALNLTVDLKVSPEALGQILRLQQQNRLRDIARVRATPAGP